MSNLQPETRTLLKWLGWALTMLTLLIVLLDAYTSGLTESPFKKMFDLSREANVPTWFASVLWLSVGAAAVCSFLAERLCTSKRALSWMWLMIATVFFIASADEVATVHEEIGSLLEHSLENGALGVLIGVGQQAQMAPESPWIIYYLPVLAIFSVGAGSFLFWRIRQLKLLLIACFLAADCYAIAIALDHYQGLALFRKDSISAAFHMKTSDLLDLSFWTEEIIEDIGTALLVVAFAGYACEQFVRRKEE